jgi:paraquat-inducible protein B
LVSRWLHDDLEIGSEVEVEAPNRFVIGAIALVVAGVLTFGGGQFLKPKDQFVLYFPGSLSGLAVGSPVTFRGVRVGTVTGITIKYNITKQPLRIPVHIELEPDNWQVVSGE